MVAIAIFSVSYLSWFPLPLLFFFCLTLLDLCGGADDVVPCVDLKSFICIYMGVSTGTCFLFSSFIVKTFRYALFTTQMFCIDVHTIH